MCPPATAPAPSSTSCCPSSAIDNGPYGARPRKPSAKFRPETAPRAVIDKLLPLLGDPDSDVRSAAAQALGQIPPGDRAGAVIDKLLPLLGDPNSEVRSAALRSISRLGPASSTSAIAAIRDIDAAGSEATGWLRAAAHIATGADTKQEGSELLLAWLGHPAALPSDSVADKPGAAHEVLELLTNNWAAIAKEPRAREEAENAAMAAAVNAACRTPAETDNFADLARAASAWVRDLPFEGPVHRCWSSEQRSTVEKLLTDFKELHSTHENALAAHLKGEEIAPVSLWLTRGVVAWTLAWAVFLVAFPWSRIVQSIFFWNPRARKLISIGVVPLLAADRAAPAPAVAGTVSRRSRRGGASRRLAESSAHFPEGHARIDGGDPVSIRQLKSGLRGVVVVRADFRPRQD